MTRWAINLNNMVNYDEILVQAYDMISDEDDEEVEPFDEMLKYTKLETSPDELKQKFLKQYDKLIEIMGRNKEINCCIGDLWLQNNEEYSSQRTKKIETYVLNTISSYIVIEDYWWDLDYLFLDYEHNVIMKSLYDAYDSLTVR
jgi:hypothetical protein